MSAKKVIFRSKEEAEAETGHFSVSSIMITWELADKISTFIGKEKLSTFSQPNQAKTCHNTYTLNWTLKRYNDPEKKRAYLASPGAIGYYKHTLKTKRYRINPGSPDSYIHEHKPKEEDVQKFKELEERTPSIEQMYFWIVQKYSRDILWMDYSQKAPSGIFLDTDAGEINF